MSLSSFLLGSGKSKASASATIDNELDTLFQSTKIVPPPRHPSTATSEKKRKALATLDEDTEPKQSEVKRKKSTKEGDEVKSSKDETLKGEKPKEKGGRTKKEKGERRAKKVRLDDSEDEDEDENDPGLEDAYVKGRVAKLAGRDKESQVKKARATTVKGVEDGVKADVKMKGSDADGSSGSEVEEDDEEDASRLVHESLSGSKSRKDRRVKRTKKEKYAPPEETTEQRNERTIFVGNVAVEVAKSKSALKSFKRHILSNLPTSISSTAKIESTRIRSVAFSLPTSKLDPTTSETTSDPSKNPSSDAASKLNHEKARVASWRASHSTKDDEDNDNEKKSKLSSQEKKRVAFIKKDIHDSADSVHVYVVFAHSRPQPTPSADHSEEKTSDTTAITTQTQTMSPYEVAALSVQHCNATVFMERTIRVDRVSTTSTAAANSASSSNAVAAKTNGTDGVGADPKKTVFVGNLDFASKEEDLRVYFEGVISGERGPRGDESDDEVSDEEDEENGEQDKEDGEEDGSEDGRGKRGEKGARGKKVKSWVTSVRIVRDRDTQLGKGFAYVQFADRECVDEILALGTSEENKLKFAKRKLRVQKCKTVPGVKLSSTNARSQVRAAAAVSARTTSHPQSNSSNPRIPNSNTKSFARGSNATPTGIRSPAQKSRVPIIVPKGDPSLGTKLAHLPKEARKEAKSQDADRVARRLAKKKARGQMDSQMRKGGDGEVKVRNRERVKSGAKGKVGGKGKGGGGKTRMRSDKSMMKRNGKK